MNTKPFIPSDPSTSNLENLISHINTGLREKEEQIKHNHSVVVSVPLRYTKEILEAAMQEFRNLGWEVSCNDAVNILTFKWGGIKISTIQA